MNRVRFMATWLHIHLLNRLRSFSRLWDSPERLLTVLAIGIGLITGLGAIGFMFLIEFVRDLCFGKVGVWLVSVHVYFWLLPLLPMAGGLLVGLITYYFAPEAEGHGVPEVMDAMARQGARIRPRVAGAKAVASALTIGSGGAAGTEGPIIQIGAAIGSTLGQWLHMSVNDLRVLIGCGTAAGIASIFNAPIAGVLFAVEVLLRDISLRSFVPIIMSSVASSSLTRAIRGDRGPLFPVPTEITSGSSIYTFSVGEIGNYIVLGLICGLVAWLFVKLLYFTEDAFKKMPGHKVFRPVVGAAILGILASGTELITSRPVPPHRVKPELQAVAPSAQLAASGEQPAIMGNSYSVIGQTLDPKAYGSRPDTAETWTLRVLLILLAAKIAATCLTLGSGGSGGVFAPSLFIGATTGGAFGLVVAHSGVFPGVSPGAYALVGMAAVVAASIHAPMTAALLLFELTGDYEVIVPILLSGVLALVVAQRLEPASIYTMKLLRRGVDIYKGQDISVLKHVKVREQMRPDPATVRVSDGLMNVIERFVVHPGTSLFVTDDDHRLLGVIAGQHIRAMMANPGDFEPFIIAHDIMQESGFPVLAPGDTLADAMRPLARYRGEVPVVEDGHLVGVIWPEDVLERYNAELFRREMASSMAATVSAGVRSEPIPTLKDASIVELPVPARFVGHSVASLDIRNRYGVTVLLIKKLGAQGREVSMLPTGDYVFEFGDTLLVMGPNHQLKEFQYGGMGVD